MVTLSLEKQTESTKAGATTGARSRLGDRSIPGNYDPGIFTSNSWPFSLLMRTPLTVFCIWFDP